MKRFLDRIWHKLRGYEWIPDAINAETGSMDDYCTCRWCKVLMS